jgi:hypothetical protein
MPLRWVKSTKGLWCRLDRVRLAHEHFDGLEGVFVVFACIWMNRAQAIRLGQGRLRERLEEMRSDEEVAVYAASGLSVTWATVWPPDMDGVERFLAESLRPRVKTPVPTAPAVRVNLPEW